MYSESEKNKEEKETEQNELSSQTMRRPGGGKYTFHSANAIPPLLLIYYLWPGRKIDACIILPLREREGKKSEEGKLNKVQRKK